MVLLLGLNIYFLCLLGLNTAVISIAGQNFGARRYDRIKEVIFYSNFYRIYNNVLISGILIFIFAEIIISIFSSDLEVLKFGATYLKNS